MKYYFNYYGELGPALHNRYIDFAIQRNPLGGSVRINADIKNGGVSEEMGIFGDLADFATREQEYNNVVTSDLPGLLLETFDRTPYSQELQVAKTLTGASTRKIVGYRTAVDIDEENDGQWLRMKDVVSATDGKISWGGKTYTAPAAGSYRIGLFNERDSRLGGEVGNDVNRDGNPAGSSGIFAVLWSTTTTTVWVDA